MGISGTQKALMQSRSGAARSGATRSGYYLANNAIITIENNGVPVDVSRHIAYNGWSISLNINDEVDTATIKLLPTLPFVPQTRSQVRIALGAGSLLTFAGIIVTIQKSRRQGPDPRFWYDVMCIDWMALFDAHLVVAEYPTQSATTTILDIVQRFTRGSFSTVGVAANLPTFQAMSIVNERPSTVIRRITNGIGGGFWIDAERRLRAWSATVPSPIQESSPEPLTDHLSTLKTFRMTEDGSQMRTRMWVEGRNTSTLLGVPANVPAGRALWVPVSEARVFPDVVTLHDRSRVGIQLGARIIEQFNPAPDASQNPPGTTLTAPAAPGDQTLLVADASQFPALGWMQLAGQILYFSKVSDTVLGIGEPQMPNYGTLRAPVSAGAQMVLLPWIHFDPHDRDATSGFMRVASRAQPEGSPVVLAVMRQADAMAAVLAAREDSDGFHEHLVQDGRYSAAGALARAEAELANFSQPLVSYEWETTDLNAAPGRMQHIALVNGTPVVADVRITNVEIVPVVANYPPRRSVRATQVQPASVLDVWIDDPR